MHTTLTPIYLASFGFSPMIVTYSDSDIFELGLEMLSESSISNSVDMSIPTDIYPSVGRVLDLFGCRLDSQWILHYSFLKYTSFILASSNMQRNKKTTETLM